MSEPKIGPFGIPILTEEERLESEREGSVRLVVRVADVDPHLGSAELRARRIKVRCLSCGEPCWFDPHASYPRFAKVVCLHCAPTYLKKATT